MKTMVRWLIAVILTLSLLVGCSPNAEVDSAAVLSARRETVCETMKAMSSVRWTVEQDTPYSLRTGFVDIEDEQTNHPDEIIMLKAGEIYEGLPYTHGIGNYYSFEDYLSETADTNGVRTLNITSHSLSGGSKTARIGNSCSGAVEMAWGSVSNSFVPAATKNMTPANGYLKVGTYEAATDVYENTKKDCQKNGWDAMYAAYAELQKGDAVVRFLNGSGHTLLITDVKVNRTSEGVIHQNSYVILSEQDTSNVSYDVYYFDDTLQRNVRPFYTVDRKLTFSKLYSMGYLPITCQELIDATASFETYVKDTVKKPTLDNLFTGSVSTNNMIHSLTIRIADKKGNTVQESTCYAWRGQFREFPLERFTQEDPRVLNGVIDLNALPAGTYRCTLTAEISTGETFTTRKFTFKIK